MMARIQKDCIKWIESDSEDLSFYKRYINKLCSFKLSIHQRILKKIGFNIYMNKKQLSK